MRKYLTEWIMGVLFLLTVFSFTGRTVYAAEGQKLVAITFDDGSGPYTDKLLDGLKKTGAHATFFTNTRNGSYGTDHYYAQAERILAEGHQLANHTYSHKVPFGKLSGGVISSEVTKALPNLYKAAGGAYDYFVRTPGGANTPGIRNNISAPIIRWDVDTLDWKYRNVSTVYSNIMKNTKDGSIILLHDIHKTSVDAALKAIPALQARGYEVVTVSELFRRKGVEPKKSVVYNSLQGRPTVKDAYALPVVKCEAGMITISGDEGLSFYYTTDGTLPKLNSRKYTGSFTLPEGTELTVAGIDRYAVRTESVTVKVEAGYPGVFDAKYYLSKYPGLTESVGTDANALLQYYLKTGIGKGDIASPVFDITYYMSRYPDLQKKFGSNRIAYAKHFVNYGMKEGRQGIASFSVSGYKNRYADLRAAYGNDTRAYYMHYVRYGAGEKRSGAEADRLYGAVHILNGVDYSDVYEYNYYMKVNPDLKNRFGSRQDDLGALKHFVLYGMQEGRIAKETFNVKVYRACNPDLQNVFGEDWKKYYRHYLTYGRKEGRKAA